MTTFTENFYESAAPSWPVPPNPPKRLRSWYESKYFCRVRLFFFSLPSSCSEATTIWVRFLSASERDSNKRPVRVTGEDRPTVRDRLPMWQVHKIIAATATVKVQQSQQSLLLFSAFRVAIRIGQKCIVMCTVKICLKKSFENQSFILQMRWIY